jgi:hypothetical protein
LMLVCLGVWPCMQSSPLWLEIGFWTRSRWWSV